MQRTRNCRARSALAGAALGALALSGCSLPDSTAAVEVEGTLIEPAEVNIAVVTHAAPGDQFWDFVRSGVDKATDDLGIQVSYNNSPDPGDQSTLIDNAIAQGANGLVVSMANPPALRAAVRAAANAGIPVVTINSGIDDWEEFGAFTHVGQSEAIAGEAAGERLSKNGLRNVLCVIQEPGNIALEERCRAASKAFNGQMSNLQVDGTDTTGVVSSITSRLRADNQVDGVLTLSGQISALAVQAIGGAGSEAEVATFDVDQSVLQGILSEEIAFAIDQQPFAQGYQGVSAVYLQLTGGVTLGGGQPIYTGPTIIDQENAETSLASLNGAS